MPYFFLARITGLQKFFFLMQRTFPGDIHEAIRRPEHSDEKWKTIFGSVSMRVSKIPSKYQRENDGENRVPADWEEQKKVLGIE